MLKLKAWNMVVTALRCHADALQDAAEMPEAGEEAGAMRREAVDFRSLADEIENAGLRP